MHEEGDRQNLGLLFRDAEPSVGETCEGGGGDGISPHPRNGAGQALRGKKSSTPRWIRDASASIVHRRPGWGWTVKIVLENKPNVYRRCFFPAPASTWNSIGSGWRNTTHYLGISC